MRRVTSPIFTALLVLASASAWAQIQPTVSFETKASRADVALPALGKQLGLSLSVANEMASEVMVIRLRNAPSEAALEKIAVALSGAWVKSGTDWRLERTGEARAELVQADQLRLAEAIKKWAKEQDERQLMPGQVATEAVATSVPIPPDEDGEEVDPQEAAQRKAVGEVYKQHGEAQRKIWKAIRAALDPASIVAVGFGDRVVMSSAPTASQRGLPAPVLAAIREFNQGAQARMQALAKTGMEPEQLEEMSLGPIHRMLLIMKRVSPYSWQVRIMGLDRANQVRVQNYFQPTAIDQPALMMMFDPDQVTKIKESTLKINNPKTSIPTSESFKSFAVFINSITQGAPPPMLDTKEMLTFFRNPMQFDPLSQTASAALLAIAEDQKAQLVAVVSDDAFVLESAAMYNRELTVGTAASALESLGTAQMESKDGWVTMKPAFPSVSPRARLDRKALQALISKEEATGSLSIMDKAAFMLTYPEYSELLWQIYQFLAAPSLMEGAFEGGMGANANAAYRFFGSLNPPERDALLSGQAVPLYRLTAAVRSRFVECLEEVQALGGENPAARNMFAPPLGMDMPGEEEPPKPFADFTDVSVQTVAQSYVTAKPITDIIVKPVGDQFSIFMMQTMTPETLAMIKQMMNSPDTMGFAGMLPKLDKLRPGTRTRLDLEFTVVPKFGGRHLLSGVQMTGDRNGVPESQLPASFLAALRKAEEMYRGIMDGGEMPGEMPDEGGQGTTP